MADAKISALDNLTSADPANDMIPIVDVSATPPASGNTKRISINNLLACSPTATLASATITGAATVGTTLGVTGNLTVDTSTFFVDSSADKVGVGTTSLSGEKLTVAGNISANAWIGRSNIAAPTGDCSIFRSADNTLAFGITSSTAMTLNSTGLGIGASPSYTLDIRKNAAGGRFLSYHTGGNGTLTAATDLNEMRSDDTTTAYNLLNVNLVGSSRFLVKSTGDVVIGVTAGNLNVGSSGDVGKLYVRKDSLTDQVVQIGNEAATGKMITFHTNGNTQVGSISFASSSVAYNTSSDYRLKESVKPISGGLARVNALKPSAYKWKVDGSNGEGFIAHELAETVPFAVTGDKDAVDANGKPTYQGVDLSKLVPILVAAIQELTARVQTLEAR